MNKRKHSIHSFWQNKALTKAPGTVVTHGDLNQVSMEINLISALLKTSDILLDIGCGNGFATSIYAQKCKKTIGVDYSENMIKSAQKKYRQNERLSFYVGNILSLKYRKPAYSVVVSTRCLINLTSWNEQKRAIKNIHKILKKGGRLILVEGIKQGRDRLNNLRVRAGLKRMPRVWHNVDFDESKLLRYAKRYFVIKKDVRPGLYDVLTRVAYPLSIYPKSPAYGTRYQVAAEKLYYLLDGDTWREYSREACLELIKR